MPKIITLSPTLALQWFLAVCAGISTVAVAIGHVIKIIHAARAPQKALKARLETLEKTADEYRKYFSRDKERLDAYEEGSRVTQRAILALLAHSIDGNDVDALKKAKAALENFLIER